MSYPLRRLSDIYRQSGPWVTIQIDVGRDVQPAGQAIDLRRPQPARELADQGTPDEFLAAVDTALTTPVQGAAAACRYLLVSSEGVAVDEVLHESGSCENTASFGELPLVAPLVEGGAHDLPYLIVEAARTARG